MTPMHLFTRRFFPGLISALSAYASVCAIHAADAPPAPTTPTESAALPALVRANNAFALDVYRQFAPAPGVNVFFSPYSVSTALAMTWAGAHGQTEVQMAQTLRLAPLSATIVAPAYSSLSKSLDDAAAKSGVKLAIANSLWPQSDHPFRDEYLNIVKSDFQSEVIPVNFHGNSALTGEDKSWLESICNRVNAWVESKTNNRIKDLLHPGDVSPDTRLVLINAIYFKGDWAEPFDSKVTENAPFSLAGGGVKTTALMRKKMQVRYADLPNEPVPLQIAALPYKNGALEFFVVLPKSADALPDMERNLTADLLAAWLDKLSRPRELDVYLPKFKLTARYDLIPPLKKLGLSDAFTAAADFSGMDGARDLMISGVFHQAYIEVNEEGTEAAAATGVVMRLTAVLEPTIFRADHPFLFFIRDTATGSILFMGRFATPPEGN